MANSESFHGVEVVRSRFLPKGVIRKFVIGNTGWNLFEMDSGGYCSGFFPDGELYHNQKKAMINGFRFAKAVSMFREFAVHGGFGQMNMDVNKLANVVVKGGRRESSFFINLFRKSSTHIVKILSDRDEGIEYTIDLTQFQDMPDNDPLIVLCNRARKIMERKPK